MTAPLRLVPFDGLWEMAIDVPYSMLAGRGDLAWSCGQLALGAGARVQAPGDLLAQVDIVADHLGTILRRAGLDRFRVRRLVAYYVPKTERDGPALTARLEERLGKAAMIDLVPVPVFYYDGVRLEIDLFCGEAPIVSDGHEVTLAGGAATARFQPTAGETWLSFAAQPAALDAALEALREACRERGLEPQNCLEEHWTAPEAALASLGASSGGFGQGFGAGFDPGAVVGAGSDDPLIRLRARVRSDAVALLQTTRAGCGFIVRECGPHLWLQGRAGAGVTGLVGQTAAIMQGADEILAEYGIGFEDVIKQTAHYCGGSAEELHDNMGVRNAYYSKPGPASTGIPVRGFEQAATRTVIDLRLLRGWKHSAGLMDRAG